MAARAAKTHWRALDLYPPWVRCMKGIFRCCEEASAENDITVLSIYVNPTQFNNPDDLANYPDTLSEDLESATEVGVDYVLMPTYDQIYADGFRYQVDETEFSRELCGTNRPGHFTGVLTVVMKLLNLVQADRAYFGKKDFQQYQLIKDMCQTFFMQVEIVGCDTVREQDGLAMSSRNKLLSRQARCKASDFYRASEATGVRRTRAAATVCSGLSGRLCGNPRWTTIWRCGG